ncbi:MAG: TIGR02147 family protein [Proteobacteria bacterium]|nr:TIGR02147 family protein [Pseudomonadota bacterium]
MIDHRKQISSLLQNEFSKRRLDNPKYSMRDFSREVGISIGHLSEVLRGKHSFSARLAQQVSERLNLNKGDSDMLELSAAYGAARSIQTKKCIQTNLKKTKNAITYSQLRSETIRSISDWLHLGILEYVKTNQKSSTTSEIAKAFETSDQIIDGCLRRLKMAGLLKKSGRQWTQVHKDIAIDSKVPSVEIQNYHKSILKKASEALSTQNVSNREFQSLVLPVNPEDLTKAKAMIADFVRTFDSTFSKSSDTKNIYAINVQLFSLTN